MFVIVMDKSTDLVWYASYGSNISEERFLCYIKGGKPKGASKTYIGCTDPTLPSNIEEFYITSELYFAKSSSTWNNGGVGFLRNDFNKNAQTWGRMYLITKEQFVQVLQQEIGGKAVQIDFDRARTLDYVFAPGSWYSKIIYLGDHHGYPIFTFTHEKDLPETSPSPAYLSTIAAGIKECFPYSNREIAEYFIAKAGVKNSYNITNLMEILVALDETADR
ncbi:hypothetical protein BDE36_3497 [Arcticibacter tournemirensis]|nr:hypothetical protein BDE36_3497 [Arcticibacter tournemirensis]